jgi:tRNA-dihydrouridine synthase A
MKNQSHKFCVAPMMDWTTTHCRSFHRVLTRTATLYTEMVTADAVIHGDRDKLLGFDPAQHPLVLQLGGSNPEKLYRASRIGVEWGYDAINLNVGCPSVRVQDGRFGACLMKEPSLVGELVKAMAEGAQGRPIEVKHRLGVDDQDPEESLFRFVETVAASGCSTFIVHARKAWLQGLSPRENRDIPPLDYGIVRALKAARPDLAIHLNGGLQTIAQAKAESEGLDGAMVGRAVYQAPALLKEVDPIFRGQKAPVEDAFAVLDVHEAYMAARLAEGVPLQAMARSMLGLFQGRPGGRLWRRILTVEGVKRGAGLEVIRAARNAVEIAAVRRGAAA